jgi:hypothetical protein
VIFLVTMVAIDHSWGITMRCFSKAAGLACVALAAGTALTPVANAEAGGSTMSAAVSVPAGCKEYTDAVTRIHLSVCMVKVGNKAYASVNIYKGSSDRNCELQAVLSKPGSDVLRNIPCEMGGYTIGNGYTAKGKYQVGVASEGYLRNPVRSRVVTLG